MAGYSPGQQLQEIVTVDTVAKTYAVPPAAPRAGQRPADPSRVVCRGPGLKRAQCGVFNSVQVDASDAGVYY